MEGYRILSDLTPVYGKNGRRIGRGIGSGRGKTSGKGHKGAKARSGGGAPRSFEGGQMPLYRRLPKRGFNSMADKKNIGVVNIDMLQRLVDADVIKSNSNVTIDTLKEVGLVREGTQVVRLLGRGGLKSPLIVSVHHASETATKAVVDCGGKVEIIGAS